MAQQSLLNGGSQAPAVPLLLAHAVKRLRGPLEERGTGNHWGSIPRDTGSHWGSLPRDTGSHWGTIPISSVNKPQLHSLSSSPSVAQKISAPCQLCTSFYKISLKLCAAPSSGQKDCISAFLCSGQSSLGEHPSVPYSTAFTSFSAHSLPPTSRRGLGNVLQKGTESDIRRSLGRVLRSPSSLTAASSAGTSLSQAQFPL